jgi:hypothetical protein
LEREGALPQAVGCGSGVGVHAQMLRSDRASEQYQKMEAGK